VFLFWDATLDAVLADWRGRVGAQRAMAGG